MTCGEAGGIRIRVVAMAALTRGGMLACSAQRWWVARMARYGLLRADALHGSQPALTASTASIALRMAPSM